MNDKTLYLIAYDIPQDRRRTKVHRLLCGYGAWTQFSLFECWLTKKQLVEMRAKLHTLIDDSEDSVRLYGLCVGCVARTETIGSSKPRQPDVFMC
ncbi:MAG: CRISPR-associated endonuclease Cas2 [Herpetosiphon sp.]|nr:CRISPR-associated endonuclease Cas2 [Herpetosiphon sp.]